MKKEHKKRTKIVIYGKHIAWIESDMLKNFNEILKIKGESRNEWIKDQCFSDFSIELQDTNSIILLDKAVKDNLYNDKSDWLRDKIREEFRNFSKKNILSEKNQSKK